MAVPRRHVQELDLPGSEHAERGVLEALDGFRLPAQDAATVGQEEGAPWEILRRWMAGELDLVVSPRLLHELQAVLARERFRRYFTYEEATAYVSWLHHGAEVVRDPAENVVRGTVEADPDDEYLVRLAGTLAGSDSYLLSVARHLLDLTDPSVKDDEGRTLARILAPGKQTDSVNPLAIGASSVARLTRRSQ